jgi:hypothetical protein
MAGFALLADIARLPISKSPGHPVSPSPIIPQRNVRDAPTDVFETLEEGEHFVAHMGR